MAKTGIKVVVVGVIVLFACTDIDVRPVLPETRATKRLRRQRASYVRDQDIEMLRRTYERSGSRSRLKIRTSQPRKPPSSGLFLTNTDRKPSKPMTNVGR